MLEPNLKGKIVRVSPRFGETATIVGYTTYIENFDPLEFTSISDELDFAQFGDEIEYKQPMFGKPKFIKNCTKQFFTKLSSTDSTDSTDSASLTNSLRFYPVPASVPPSTWLACANDTGCPELCRLLLPPL